MRRATRTAVLVVAAALFPAPVTSARSQEAAPPTRQLVFGVKAANFGRTTLEEGQFSYSLEAGSSVEDGIVLINYKKDPIVVRLYAADVINAKGGGLAPEQRDAEMRGVGAWLKLKDPELSTVGIPGRERRTVPFELRVPKGTPPGDYPGAVVAALDVGRSAEGLSVQTRTAMMVRLKVPGTIDLGVGVSELRTKRVSDGYRFDVDVRNTGNVLFTMVGAVELRRGGRVMGRVPLIPKDIYVIPDGKADLRGVWKAPPAFGRVKAIARISVAINRKPSGTYSSPALTMTLLPLLIGGVVVVLLAIIVAVLFVTRKRRRAWRARRHDERELLRAHRAGRRPLTKGPAEPDPAPLATAVPARSGASIAELDISIWEDR